MLVYNIGRLSEGQPPHFMMLASVSQSRTFSGTSGFQWSEALAATNPITLMSHAISPTTTVTTTSSSLGEGSGWQAGPFSTASSESPTITYIPVHGQDFFNRFESPLRDRFLYFLEYSQPKTDLLSFFDLFADSLVVLNGDVSGNIPFQAY